jgi:hypothetical protein
MHLIWYYNHFLIYIHDRHNTPITMTTSSSTTVIPSVFSVPISEKLTKSNYLLWHAHVMSTIRVADLEGFLTDDEEPVAKTITTKDDKGHDVQQYNPAYS